MVRPCSLYRISINAAILIIILLDSCHEVSEHVDGSLRPVKAVVVTTVSVPNEISGFGVLAYSRKVDICSSQEGVLSRLPFREGDGVEQGSVLALLTSPQLELSVGRAANVVEQAKAALSLAEARLFEGRLSCESRSLGIEKSLLELQQAERRLAEADRKQLAQERLYEAGGVTEEAIRSGRFTIESAREELEVIKKDIQIRLIGLRDDDLRAGGMSVPTDPSERQRSLNDLSTASQKAEACSALARLDAALKEQASAKLALSELTILSPMSGVIGARYLEVGERVRREDKLFTVIDSSSLYAIASIDEAVAIRLNRGMKAQVFVDAANMGLEGTLDYISPMADAKSASFSIRVACKDPTLMARPGMFARIVVTQAAPSEVLFIPRTAILDRLGKQGKVFLLAGGIVVERRLGLGEEMEEGTCVLEGLECGDVIIDKPDPGIKEGDRVEVSR
ncbi:MAG: efflux RND transporter periplasmic adaptor subunit [Spirochaetia bacterium]|jgi:RND family efflux transporter MFP subunit|nr:efflux RND transporter periplasmic adaptor subunit [Spirochaetia bacterium]